jgi:hypothetical protein
VRKLPAGEWHHPQEKQGGGLMGLGILAALTAAVIGAFVVIVGIIAVFFYAILGALMGAITGFILMNVPVLGPLVVNGFHQIGLQNVDLTSVGAALGFVAGFFKGSHEHK